MFFVVLQRGIHFLYKTNGNDFNYIGIDLFGGNQSNNKDEIEPTFLKDQKFSNQKIFIKLYLKENF